VVLDSSYNYYANNMYQQIAQKEIYVKIKEEAYFQPTNNHMSQRKNTRGTQMYKTPPSLIASQSATSGRPPFRLRQPVATETKLWF